MTKAELRTLVQANVGRTDKDTVINNALDFALTTLSQTELHDDLRRELDSTCVISSTFVQLPSTLSQLLDVRLVDPTNPSLAYPLVILRKLEFVRMFPNVPGNAITGRPTFSFVEAGKLNFNCITQAEYTIRITGFFLGEFFADTGENPIKNADEALTAYATANLYESIQMYDDAARWQGQWKFLVKNLINAKQKELGVSFVARPWVRNTAIESNAPWLDPFAGVIT